MERITRLHAATGSLKGATKRGDVKSSQGENARALLYVRGRALASFVASHCLSCCCNA